MKFFNALDGSHYPVSRIRRIGYREHVVDQGGMGKAKVFNVYLDDDVTVEVYGGTRDRLVRMGTVISAALGYRAFTLHGLTTEDIHAEMVIAWAISDDLTPSPITPSGVWKGVSNCDHVLTPDGQVISSWGDTWPTLQAYVDDPEVQSGLAERAKQ